MAGVGDWGTKFEGGSGFVAMDLVASVAASLAVTGRSFVAAPLFAIALLSVRERPASTVIEAHRLCERIAVVCVAAGLYAPPLQRWVAGGLIAATLAIVLHRVADAFMRRPGRAWKLAARTLLVGDKDDVRRAAQLFASHPEHLVRPVATATPAGVPTVLPNVALDVLAPALKEYGIEHVVVVTPRLGDHVLHGIGRNRPLGVRVSVLPPMAEVLTTGAQIVDVRGLPFLSLAPRRRPSGPQWWAKRIFDFTVAAIGLLAVSPVLALVSLATLIDSGRPIFFRQTRVGRDGRLFDLWKFRSMSADAERRLAELRDANEATGPYFKIENDPRVTTVGRWLRRLSLDELPQLFNVLRGDMSLVGPRPFLPTEMEANPEMFEWRLPFLPGITGLWQVAGRSWLPVAEGLRMDLAYIEHWSLGLDLRIILRTASAALRGDRRPSVVGVGSLPLLTRSRYLGLVDGDDLVASEVPCDLSVVIVSHESRDDIVGCLDSLRALPDRVSREVIVVDNASNDGTADLVARQYPEVRLIRKRHRDGFATNANVGAVAAAGRHVLFLNPDTVVFSDSLDRLVDHLDTHPECGVVGPRLVYPDGRHQASARRFPTPVTTVVRRTPLRWLIGATSGVERHLMEDTALSDVMQVDWMLGAVVAVRREAFHAIGGFDDRFRLYCEDIDLCWRFHEAGFRVEYLTTATVQHALGELTAKRFFTVRTIWHFRSMVRFVRLHGLRQPESNAPHIGPRVPRPIGRIELIDGAPVSPPLSESVA